MSTLPVKRPYPASPAKPWPPQSAKPATRTPITFVPYKTALVSCSTTPAPATPSLLLEPEASAGPATSLWFCSELNIRVTMFRRAMRIDDAQIRQQLSRLAVELQSGIALSTLTSLGIGGITDLLRVTRHESIPA